MTDFDTATMTTIDGIAFADTVRTYFDFRSIVAENPVDGAQPATVLSERAQRRRLARNLARITAITHEMETAQTIEDDPEAWARLSRAGFKAVAYGAINGDIIAAVEAGHETAVKALEATEPPF